MATGVAALGTILASHIRGPRSPVTSAGRRSPRTRTGSRTQISTGGTRQAIASTSPPLRGLVAETARAAFVNGLNTILLISAIVAFTAAALSFVLIRERDFVGPAVTKAGDEGEQAAEVALAA